MTCTSKIRVIIFPGFLEIAKPTMKNSCLLLIAATLAATGVVANAGDISGTVKLKGTPPPEKEITPLKDDANCGKLHTSVPKTRFYVVGSGGGLADVIVVLKGEGLSGKSTGASAAPLVLDQHGCEYVPYIMAVQTDQKIMVKNSDPVLHNVHAVPTANPEKNSAQAAGSPDMPFSFAKPENFLKFQCDVHPWMFAFVTVVDHPYFAVTDKEGKFTIKNVPDGKYTLTAFHRRAAPVSAPVKQEVEVKGGNLTQDLTLEAK
jgi:hypothetical protein